MTRHAIVNKDTKKVVNVVIWQGAEWLPPRNHLVIQNDKVSPFFDQKKSGRSASLYEYARDCLTANGHA